MLIRKNLVVEDFISLTNLVTLQESQYLSLKKENIASLIFKSKKNHVYWEPMIF